MAGSSSLPSVADIINEALAHIGVYSGDPLSAADQQTAFFTLGAIVDGWGAELLTILQTNILTFSTVAGQGTYTIGPDATNNWVTSTLPIEFEACGLIYGSGTGALELPVEIITSQQWESIALKSMQSPLVQMVWPDLGYPSHSLYFWPVPSVVAPVVLYLPQQVQRFTSVTNTVGLPPGYLEALIFELAIKCSSKFGAQVPPWLPDAWADAKARLRASNIVPLDVVCDPAIVGTARKRLGGSIEFYTGS